MLPRLVIAGIGIWVSFSVIIAYIEVMNTIGRGIGDIMLAPFADGARDFSLQNIAGAAGDGTGIASEGLFTALAVAGTAGAIAGIGGIFGLISLAITVAFGFIVAVVTLTLRQMVIIILLIMAPLGIAAWILPNTEKYLEALVRHAQQTAANVPDDRRAACIRKNLCLPFYRGGSRQPLYHRRLL